MADGKSGLGERPQLAYDPQDIVLSHLVKAKEIANMRFGIPILLVAGSALLPLGCGSGGGGGNIPTCSGTFKACGGDLTGKWSIDGICIEGDLQSALSGSAEDMPSECADMLQGVSVQVSGTVEFANGSQISDATTKMDMKFKYTSACASALSGMSLTLNQGLCDTLATQMNSDEDEDVDEEMTAACSFSGGSCNCTMSMNGHDTSTTAYTVSGNTFHTDDGDSVEYCVSGKTLITRDLSDGGLAGQTTLHRI
jgi:hypothetical protein